MHRMIQSHSYTQILASLTIALAIAVTGQPLPGQGPMVRHADADFEASGYVTPAGMVPPSMYHGSVQPVGYCDSAPCDNGCCSPSGCDSCGPTGGYGGYGGGYDHGYGGYYPTQSGCDSCNGSCGQAGCGGILGKMCAGDGDLRHICCFCRGSGCSACQFFGKGYLLGALSALLPYSDAGLCAQRWYDFSAEALFLGRSSANLGTSVFTQQGSGPGGVPVLTAGDIIDDDLTAGVRLSAAMIFGAGGNLEITYIGGQEWNDSATVTSPAVYDNAFPPNLISGADLFSFITEFGTNPTDLDDVDRSVSQSASFRSSFHSAEINYRRRTVGPYCRFQGSWLVGLRYFRYDDRLGLNIVGLTDDGINAGPQDDTLRFFNGSERVTNDLLGAQIGGDLWWNVIPGINVGVGFKGAWLNNEVSNSSNYSANSINAGAPGEFSASQGREKGTVAAELEAKIAYRLSHSWTVRSAYYLMAIDDVANSNFNAEFIREAAPGNNLNLEQPHIGFDSLTIQGVSFGAEYIW